MIKRILTMCLVGCICFIVFSRPIEAAVASNTENIVSPMYEKTSKISCDLMVTANSATIITSVRGNANSVIKCSMTIELQEKWGFLWRTKQTWSVSKDDHVMNIKLCHPITAGETYRVKVTSIVYTATDYEKISIYSGTQTATEL